MTPNKNSDLRPFEQRQGERKNTYRSYLNEEKDERPAHLVSGSERFPAERKNKYLPET